MISLRHSIFILAGVFHTAGAQNACLGQQVNGRSCTDYPDRCPGVPLSGIPILGPILGGIVNPAGNCAGQVQLAGGYQCCCGCPNENPDIACRVDFQLGQFAGVKTGRGGSCLPSFNIRTGSYDQYLSEARCAGVRDTIKERINAVYPTLRDGEKPAKDINGLQKHASEGRGPYNAYEILVGLAVPFSEIKWGRAGLANATGCHKPEFRGELTEYQCILKARNVCSGIYGLDGAYTVT